MTMLQKPRTTDPRTCAFAKTNMLRKTEQQIRAHTHSQKSTCFGKPEHHIRVHTHSQNIPCFGRPEQHIRVHTHSQTYKISEIPSNENHVLRNLKQTVRLPPLQIVFELNERDTRVILKNLFSKPVWLFSFIGFTDSIATYCMNIVPWALAILKYCCDFSVFFL